MIFLVKIYLHFTQKYHTVLCLASFDFAYVIYLVQLEITHVGKVSLYNVAVRSKVSQAVL